MRGWLTGLATGLAGACLLAGGCPLLDLDQIENQPAPSRKLAIVIVQPTADRAVPLGSTLPIEWSAANLTGQQAIATVLVRARADLSETILDGGIVVDAGGTRRTVAWDTTGFSGGAYVVVVRIEGEGVRDEQVSAAAITLNTPPSLEFLEPSEDMTLPEPQDAGDADAVTIRWTASDPDGDGQVQIGLDPDVQHDNGDEVILFEGTISTAAGFDSIDFDGTDKDGAGVDGGTYNLYAKLSDSVSEGRFVDAAARITIPERPEDVELSVTAPSEDTEFLATADPLHITFTLSEDADVLIDLKVDADDDHRNGNEITILSQRLIAEGTTEDSFDWNGADADGAPVADGIYRVVLVLTREEGAPAVVESEGLVFRRSLEDKPLIALLAPGSNVEVEAGDFVTIRWRDDDPGETATIRLTFDDDELPGESSETDGPEVEILASREAKGDGVQDRYDYQVRAGLAPGRYFLFAYVGRPGMGDEHSSVAAGQFIIPDPLGGN